VQAKKRSGAAPAAARELSELAAGVVLAVVRLRREQHEQAKPVVRWMFELGRERVGDLGRPEELVLEVDEPLRRADGGEIRLEDRELAPWKRVVDLLGHGADDLQLRGAGRRRGRRCGELLARDFAPAEGESARRRPRPPGR
jgi:hypothetical protein